MAHSLDQRFANIVHRAGKSARACLCDGDARSAVVWDPASEITIRLALRRDEVWLIAGSGTLIRFVASSEGEFDDEGIDTVIDLILGGEAVEHFGVRGQKTGITFTTGYRLDPAGGFSGGLNASESLFQARIGGPLKAARTDLAALT